MIVRCLLHKFKPPDEGRSQPNAIIHFLGGAPWPTVPLSALADWQTDNWGF
jgi:hypothetical protein